MIGQTLGHYRILEKVATGGMGVVYRARDEQLDRDVALKVLPSGTLSDDAARRQFRKEAMALAKLNHPNIETVYEFGTEDGMDFIVMEYVPGKTLADRLRGGALPEKEVVALGIQIAAGLEEAHERGIVHRDLKPANIAITARGQAKILDFGLAKLLRPVELGTTETFNDSHGAAGTLPYMPPEQLRGEPVDARVDIYTFGAVLYEMATDRRAFQEEQPSRLIDAILHQPPIPPRVLNHRAQLRADQPLVGDKRLHLIELLKRRGRIGPLQHSGQLHQCRCRLLLVAGLEKGIDRGLQGSLGLAVFRRVAQVSPDPATLTGIDDIGLGQQGPPNGNRRLDVASLDGRDRDRIVQRSSQRVIQRRIFAEQYNRIRLRDIVSVRTCRDRGAPSSQLVARCRLDRLNIDLTDSRKQLGRGQPDKRHAATTLLQRLRGARMVAILHMFFDLGRQLQAALLEGSGYGLMDATCQRLVDGRILMQAIMLTHQEP